MKFSSLSGGFELAPLDRERRFFKPDYKRSIYQVIPSAARLLVPDSVIFQDELGFKKKGEQDIVVNFLVDSMGSWQIDQLVNTSGQVNEFAGIIDQHISSVFPTITSTCVISYHTALTPIQHGVLNHRIYLEELDSIVDTLNLKTLDNQIKMGEPLYKAGINVISWLFNPSRVYPTIDNQVTRVHVAPWSIRGTGLSRFFKTDHSNEHFIGRGSVLTAFALVDRLIKKHETGKKAIINIYLGEMDYACHDHGPVSEMFRLELEHFIRGFHWLVKQASSSNSRIFFTITADHGQVSCENKVILNPKSFTNAKRVFKSGRVIQFHSLDNRQDELRDELRERFANNGLVISGDTILELTGSLSGIENIGANIKRKIFSRLGDQLVLLADGYNAETKKDLSDKYREEPILEFKLNGQHGSLTDKELVVPLIADTASSLMDKLANLLEIRKTRI
ncbi:MAG: alkaline phosphatase family protein [Candidatus Hodarchaeales archaeon]